MMNRTVTLICFLLCALSLLSSCKNNTEEKKEDAFEVLDEAIESNNPTHEEHDAINTLSVIQRNFETCISDDYEVIKSKNNKQQTASDYDADGISELSALIQNNNEVRLVIIERDALGNCTDQYTSGNLTKKLINENQYGQLSNTMTTRFGGPKGTSENVLFEFKSKMFDLVLIFYGDQKSKDYYLLQSTYISHENKKDKEGQIIVQDFLKKEKKTMSKLGSRTNIIVDEIEDKLYTLPELNYNTLMDLVK